MKRFLSLIGLLSVAASAALAADSDINPEITDFKFVAIQVVPDPKLVDSVVNRYEVVQINFSTSVDLAGLAHVRDRDMRARSYPCGWGGPDWMHSSYSIDLPIYDSRGEVTRDRLADTTEQALRQYYFFMPTNFKYRNWRGSLYNFPPPYDLNSQMDSICFAVPGTQSTFFSNTVQIPKSIVEEALNHRPN